MSHRLVVCALLTSCSLLAVAPAAAQEACFERLDNGVDMTGWRASTTNYHGPGSGWTVEDGALVGRQTSGQQGGILMTERSYSDVEVVFEVKVDWGCDSGFFFRTTGGNKAYQVTIDHLPESGVGSVWGEQFSQELRAIPYFLTDKGNAAVAAPNETPQFDLAEWPTIWKPTEFNEIRARVEGNPPHIQVWISGLKVTDFTDKMTRTEIEPQGPLAIQVHNAERWLAGGSVRFRNIRARDLTLPCDEPEPGAGGSGGAAGAAGSAGAGGSTAAGSGGVGAAAGQASGGGDVGGAGGAGGAGVVGGTAPSGQAGSAVTPPVSSASGDGGCGCRAARSGRWGALSAALIGLALLARGRRRARA